MSNPTTGRPTLALVSPVVTPEKRRQWVRSVLGCRELSAAQKTVLLALETFADYRDGTNAHPGEVNLADICDLTTRAVRNALALAQELGFIERTSAANSRVGRAAVYRLTALRTGTTVPVNNSTTGTALPVETPTTGTPAHHDRNRHDTTTGTAVPPTLHAPSNHPGVSPNTGTSPREPIAAHTPKPSRFCDEHPLGYRGKCPDCANARTAFEAWQAAQAEIDAALALADDLDRQRRKRGREHCPDCMGSNFRTDPDDDDAVIRCDHPNVPTDVPRLGYG